MGRLNRKEGRKRVRSTGRRRIDGKIWNRREEAESTGKDRADKIENRGTTPTAKGGWKRKQKEIN
jgi:hypothetical protein